ncbi:RRXRR domain-containing protein [Thiohalocapsa marina]|uniref:RRXRR domain-containing protein n=1 Tax=Thiohalocapsa marina TaxID=424902 RepID=UPI0036DAF834
MRRRRRSHPLGTEVCGPTGVAVLDATGHPLAPCAPARARRLLRRGRAWLLRERPPVIQLTRTPSAPSDAEQP